MLALLIDPGTHVKVLERDCLPDDKDGWKNFREKERRMFFREDIIGDPSDRLSQAEYARFGRLGYYVFNVDHPQYRAYMVHASRVECR